MSFFGHIKRHDTLEKTILEGKLEGKRKRGKPRRVWTDDIKNWLEMTVKEAGNLAYDKDQYRRYSQVATSHAIDSPASQRRKMNVSRDTPSGRGKITNYRISGLYYFRYVMQNLCL